MKRSRKKAFHKTNYKMLKFLCLPVFDSKYEPLVAETFFKYSVLGLGRHSLVEDPLES
jgi:hypothetical protein